MKQRYAVPVALLALGVSVTACQDEPTPRTVPSSLGVGDDYVAIGDSYTAAPNTGSKVANNGCFNTEVNYPHRIADATGMDLVDNSCNGATTKALTIPQPTFRGEHEPQLTKIDEDTDLVTFRLGANDDSMFSRIIGCARSFDADADGTPCADADAKKVNNLSVALSALSDNLVTALEEIEERGPNARVIVIGYPHVIPEEGTCDLLPLPVGDYVYARSIIDGLNTALEAAAAEVGVTYIDMYAASEGHDICGDEPWIAGAPIAPTGATAWHPYAAEAQAVAELVLAELATD